MKTSTTMAGLLIGVLSTQAGADSAQHNHRDAHAAVCGAGHEVCADANQAVRLPQSKSVALMADSTVENGGVATMIFKDGSKAVWTEQGQKTITTAAGLSARYAPDEGVTVAWEGASVTHVRNMLTIRNGQEVQRLVVEAGTFKTVGQVSAGLFPGGTLMVKFPNGNIVGYDASGILTVQSRNHPTTGYFPGRMWKTPAL